MSFGLAPLMERYLVLRNRDTLAQFLRLAVEDLGGPGAMLSSPITMRHRERPVAPRDMKRAINYMEANRDSPIGLPETMAAGVIDRPGEPTSSRFIAPSAAHSGSLTA